MPIDPISLALQGGGMVLDLFKAAGAAENARRSEAYNREAIARSVANAMEGRGQAMRLAGSLRQDQFGNATYYDPTQGRWVTYYTPTQRRLIEGGEQRQARAQARGAQASQDYDTLRGEYLYRRPKTEAESYADIARLISQARGTGERALNTIMDRFGVRTSGNVPRVEQMDRGPSPGQQLAETMLQARKAALEEYGTREKLHQSRYLPALKQFEETANYVAPLDPTGSLINQMTSEGLNNMLKYGSEYDKLISSMEAQGSRVGTSGQAGGGNFSFQNALGGLAKALAGDKAAAGTVGGTKGARASTSGGGGDVTLDNRFNYGLWGKGSGADAYGGEAAQRGLLDEGSRSFGQGGADPNQLTSFSPVFGDTFTYARPPVYDDLGGYKFTDVYEYPRSGTYALNPWQF